MPLPDGPQVLTDSGGQPFRVVPIKGLRHPWALAFLPNGDILVTELGGRLRIIRNGVLDPQPVAEVPEVNTRVWRAGLMDVAVHPRYADNKFIYFSYSKSVPVSPDEPASRRQTVSIALARSRFEGNLALTDVKDIFVSDMKCQSACGSRIAFAPDGTIIMTVGKPGGAGSDDPQNPANHAGKVLRLNDDGTVPKDNPFVGKAGYRPEIYALGVRSPIGLFVHPDTGEIWETEHGPMGGDEINIIRPGRNYGWPVISYGADYSGRPTGGSGPATADRKQEGMEEPFLYWNPSPAVAGILIFTGDKFPAWKVNIFVGALGAGSHLGERTNIFAEAARVTGPEAQVYKGGMTLAPCIQFGTYNIDSRKEVDILAWYAQLQMPNLAVTPGCVRTRKLASVFGWAKMGILYEFGSVDLRHKAMGKGGAPHKWQDAVKQLVHAPGSPNVARRLSPSTEV